MGHDNVAGSGFFPLHKIFQEQYENLFEAVDEIAERVRALVHRLICSWHMDAGQLAVFQGASEAPISESSRSSEQHGKTANWPRPAGLR